MDQTNWIGAFVVIGFVCYVIANNQLPGYLSVLGINDTAEQNAPESAANASVNVIGSSSAGSLSGLSGINIAP